MANTCINYERILLPLDLSSYSEATFTHALSLALAYKAELLIINVINSRGLDALDQLAAEGYAVSRDKYVESVKTDRLAQFQKEYLSRVGEVRARVIFRVGLPYEEILKTIVDEKASMIVMGTKGRSNLAGTLFGTTAEKVFRRATCPVLSVRGPEHCRLP